MLERVNVPPVRSAVPSCPPEPSVCSRFSSAAISNTLRACTPFTLGTSRPCGVSMASPMLWDACKQEQKIGMEFIQRYCIFVEGDSGLMELSELTLYVMF